HLSAVVLMELRAGASSNADRRLVDRIESPFVKARRILVPSHGVFAEAGEAIRRLRARRGFQMVARGSIVNDVLIALSARSIGATVVTQNAANYLAIQSIAAFRLRVLP